MAAPNPGGNRLHVKEPRACVVSCVVVFGWALRNGRYQISSGKPIEAPPAPGMRPLSAMIFINLFAACRRFQQVFMGIGELMMSLAREERRTRTECRLYHGTALAPRRSPLSCLSWTTVQLRYYTYHVARCFWIIRPPYRACIPKDNNRSTTEGRRKWRKVLRPSAQVPHLSMSAGSVA